MDLVDMIQRIWPTDEELAEIENTEPDVPLAKAEAYISSIIELKSAQARLTLWDFTDKWETKCIEYGKIQGIQNNLYSQLKDN